MRQRKKPTQSWMEKLKYDTDNFERVLEERIEKVATIREQKNKDQITNKELLKSLGIKMVKQKFTIKLEYPEMDAKVTKEELYGIIGTGLKCFGWDIKVQEEDISQPIYENRYNNTMCNNELQKLLKQYPDDAMVAVEYCDVKKLQYFPDRNLIAID